MTNVSVRVNINGVDRSLRKVREGLEDMETPLKRSGIYMERSIGLRFSTEPWQGLSPTTIKMHPHRAGGKPLNDTGRLKSSVTSGAVKTISGNSLRYGTNLVYAPIHNFGGTAGWGSKIPQRQFLHFDAENERRIKKIFRDYIKELHE
jgi:phage gpG-like protein